MTVIGWKNRMLVSAGYNFVPLSNRVLLPSWAPLVSHDVPFSDGLTGALEVELVAESPIYVRNGIDEEPETAKTNEHYTDFFDVDGKCVIPGSSLKGMLRSVVEIASFGKMTPRVDDHRYSVRNLNNVDLYRKKMADAQAAWLTRDEKTHAWQLIPCDYIRAAQTDIVAFFGTTPPLSLAKRQRALEKYEQLSGRSLSIRFTIADGVATSLAKAEDPPTESDQILGTLVFTGQPGGTKRHEFVFYNEKPMQTAAVAPELRNAFEFIHSNPGKGTPNEEWAFWRQKLELGERVPVFYLGKLASPESMGLARMFRLAYANSVRQTIEHSDDYKVHARPDPDLADLLFGFLPEGSNHTGLGLKGRVFVSLAEAIESQPVKNPVTAVLGSPKPTFYPSYIEQTDGDASYSTFMDSGAKIRGWKRYPVRETLQDFKIPPEAGEPVMTHFRPLQSGARFRFSVRFHNLRPEELGALWWAITWGENETHRHALGMGKAYGMGQCLLTVTGRSVHSVTGEPYEGTGLKEFVELMRKTIGAEWEQSDQIVQLLAMADPNFRPLTLDETADAVSAQQAKLNHMQLDMKGMIENEFKATETAGAYLRPHAAPGKRFAEPWHARPLAPAPVATPTIPVSLQERVNAVRKPDSVGKFLALAGELSAQDATLWEGCDFTQVGNIFNIGNVEQLLCAKMDPAIYRVCARTVLAMIKPKDDWDAERKDRFARLQAASL